MNRQIRSPLCSNRLDFGHLFVALCLPAIFAGSLIGQDAGNQDDAYRLATFANERDGYRRLAKWLMFNVPVIA